MTAAGHSRLVRGGFALALVVLVLIGFGAYQQGTENIAAAQWVNHTCEALGKASDSGDSGRNQTAPFTTQAFQRTQGVRQ